MIAAVELKSQVGPSFGNNCNNRTEEAIGTAHDFWTAYREGAFWNTAAAVIVSPRAAAGTGEFSSLSAMTELKTFVASLAGHVAAEAARLE